MKSSSSGVVVVAVWRLSLELGFVELILDERWVRAVSHTTAGLTGKRLGAAGCKDVVRVMRRCFENTGPFCNHWRDRETKLSRLMETQGSTLIIVRR